MRVRLRRPGSGGERLVSAYANGGYRAGEPTVSLPFAVALSLGYDVESTRAVEGLAYGGVVVRMRELGHIEVGVEVPDRPTQRVRCRAVCSEADDEVLLSRELMGLLKIRPLYDVNKWRLADDEEGVLRDEAEPEYFPPTGEATALKSCR